MAEMMTEETMTTAEAMQVLETCARDYLQRTTAFAKLRAAALLGHQLAEANAQHEEELGFLRDTCAAADEDCTRILAHRKGLAEDLAIASQEHDQRLRAMREELRQEKGRATQELQAFRAHVAEEHAKLQAEQVIILAALREERSGLESQAQHLRAELAATRERFLAVMSLGPLESDVALGGT